MAMACGNNYLSSLYNRLFYKQILRRHEPARILPGDKYTGLVLVAPGQPATGDRRQEGRGEE